MPAPRKRRTTKLSKDDLSKIADGFDKFGDMLIMLGLIVQTEQEVRKFDKHWRRLFRADPEELFSEIEGNPELSEKMALFAVKLAEVFSITEETDPYELQPDEQIEAGKSFKDVSRLLNEIVEGMR